jgi:hypothetical protein
MAQYYGMDFVTVSRAANQGEADLIRSRLEANGFFVNFKSEDEAISFGYGSPIGGIQVQVQEDQAESARILLEPQDPPNS